METKQDYYEKMAIAETLLPAWFTTRMLDANWKFGLLLVTGQVLCIDTITKVRGSPGDVWIDVTISMPGSVAEYEIRNLDRIFSPTSRTQASVNAAHVVMAFELARQ